MLLPTHLLRLRSGIKSSCFGTTVEVLSKVNINALSFSRILIAYILNLSIRLAVYPDKSKQGDIISVSTGKGDRSDLKNYRPISLLPVLASIFIHLRAHLNIPNILSGHQHGFVPGRSIETALLQYIAVSWNEK